MNTSATKTSMKFELRRELDKAVSRLNAYYPLQNFIACNALKGFEDQPFDQAINSIRAFMPIKGYLPLAQYRGLFESKRINPADLDEAFENAKNAQSSQSACIREFSLLELIDYKFGESAVEKLNQECAKWCAVFFDRVQAQFPISKPGSLFSWWRDCYRYDHSLSIYGVRDWRNRLEALPQSPEDAVAVLLTELQLDISETAEYVQNHLFQQIGWASYLKWQDHENGKTDVILDYLAIRLFLELELATYLLAKHEISLGLREFRKKVGWLFAISQSQNKEDYSPIWQDAFEIGYRNQLLSKLAAFSKVKEDQNFSCQLVFCIDVRSEPLRRRLEQLGPYQTFGFAGFFGMPISCRPVASSIKLALCPVLIKPKFSLAESCSNSDLVKLTNWRGLKLTLQQLRKKLKADLSSAFGFVEMFGLWSAVPIIGRTLLPQSFEKLNSLLEKKYLAEVSTDLYKELSLEEKVGLAEGAIRGIGLQSFSKLIVLCGHYSSSSNNPYASALDCGACGGNGGAYNARFAATILNDVQVRSALTARGIHVPVETTFIAATHNTCTDKVEFIVDATLSQEQLSILRQLKLDLDKVSQRVAAWRLQRLPKSALQSFNEPKVRSLDWAQIAPEWGLAGNAAFIAAPRSLTKNVDLEGRAFLHSYEFEADKDEAILELIMTAPMVVAQWINAQYYFSSTDNELLGSGDKTLHNVLGDFAVMSGQFSDLRLGLPLQSVSAENNFAHEPMRLLSLIRAPRESIDRVLLKHQSIRQLVENRWIRIVCIEPQTGDFYECIKDSQWTHIDPFRIRWKSEQFASKQSLAQELMAST